MGEFTRVQSSSVNRFELGMVHGRFGDCVRIVLV
jgi:hypothetical protein